MRTAVELRCCSSCCPAPTSCLSTWSLWSSNHLFNLCLALEFQKGICYLYILCMYLQEYYNLWGTERLSQSFYNAGLTISYRDSLVLSKAFLSNRVYSYICDKYTPLLWQSKGKRRIKIVEIFQLLSSCVWTLFTWTSLRLGLFRAFLCCGVTAFFTGPGLSALMIRIVRISFKVQFSSYIWTNQLQHNTISNDWWGSLKMNDYLFEATRVRSSTNRLLKFWSSTSPKALQ